MIPVIMIRRWTFRPDHGAQDMIGAGDGEGALPIRDGAFNK